MRKFREFLVLSLLLLPAMAAAQEPCQKTVDQVVYTVTKKPSLLGGHDIVVDIWTARGVGVYWARIDDTGKTGTPTVASDNLGPPLTLAPHRLDEFKVWYDAAKRVCPEIWK